MARLATFLWRTPAPTSVDEELAVYDDGTARLVVRRARSAETAYAIGTWACLVDESDLAALGAAGVEPVVFDLLESSPPSDRATLMARADAVASTARRTPVAVVEFYARSLPSDRPGSLAVSLLALGTGTEPVQFEVDPGAVVVHQSAGGQATGWQAVDGIVTGFMTPDAEGLGGLGSAAVIEPGRYGAILLHVPADGRPDATAVQVGGWLRHAVPDHEMPSPFEARTAPSDIAP